MHGPAEKSQWHSPVEVSRERSTKAAQEEAGGQIHQHDRQRQHFTYLRLKEGSEFCFDFYSMLKGNNKGIIERTDGQRPNTIWNWEEVYSRDVESHGSLITPDLQTVLNEMTRDNLSNFTNAMRMINVTSINNKDRMHFTNEEHEIRSERLARSAKIHLALSCGFTVAGLGNSRKSEVEKTGYSALLQGIRTQCPECMKPKRTRLEAHYSYMAKIQEVSPAESSSTDTPLEQVQNHDENDVFANVRRHSEQPESINDTYVLEKDDSNVIPDSSNICTNDNQVDQNATECVDERVALANLIANLTLDTEENKTVLKQLKKANASLTQELKECKTNLDESSRALGEATSSRDSSLIALQTKQTELEKYNCP
ncbi:hypothetical protein Tco_0536284 [Tanacetum coccineum]